MSSQRRTNSQEQESDRHEIGDRAASYSRRVEPKQQPTQQPARSTRSVTQPRGSGRQTGRSGRTR